MRETRVSVAIHRARAKCLTQQQGRLLHNVVAYMLGGECFYK